MKILLQDAGRVLHRPLYPANLLAATIVAVARVALRVLVCEIATLRGSKEGETMFSEAMNSI